MSATYKGRKYDRKVYPRFIVIDISLFNFDFQLSINLTVMFYQIKYIVQQYNLSSATLYFGPVQKIISIIDYIGWISNY